MFEEFILVFVIISAVFYIWQKYDYSYWQRHGLRSIKPTPVLGNFKELGMLKMSIGIQLKSLYNTPSFENEPVVGIYSLFRPALLVRDVNLVKKIMIKDFSYFTNRVLGSDPHHDPLGYYNLFFVRNPVWRDLKTKLSPVFTSGKIKQMYPLLVDVGKEFDLYLKSHPTGSILEFRDICSRFTCELIGSMAFGVRTNSVWDPTTDFYRHSRLIFALTVKRAFSFLITLAAPSLSSVFRTKVFSEETSQFMSDSIRHVMKEREKSGLVRNDLIDTLIAMKREALADPKANNLAKNFEFLVAQAMIFQTAGFETSSSAMSFCLYELAKAPHIQKRLREEIVEAFKEHGDWLAYEKIQELPYLGMVVDETLRKYPSASFLERECQTEPGKNYQLTDDLAIPSGTAIYVSSIGIHHDEKYWPEPQKFDPERFAPEKRDKVNKDAYMPFGTGSRNCIGMRLGLLQTKLGLCHFLRSHRVEECDQTPKKLEFDPLTPVLVPVKGGIPLRMQRCV